jgi:ArsR family transcriptional regulator, arsenate/arsenite/antimonite-responsive transcriptional repressor / arsenate reductase (thioredoxin)
MYIADVASSALSAPPSFVRLAGHPLRWRLMGELARSDRRVRELVGLLDEPQNLVSYHLGRLRSAGLVGARKSAFDARDAYYHLDLANTADALSATGERALFPVHMNSTRHGRSGATGGVFARRRPGCSASPTAESASAVFARSR